MSPGQEFTLVEDPADGRIGIMRCHSDEEKYCLEFRGWKNSVPPSRSFILTRAQVQAMLAQTLTVLDYGRGE